MTDGLTDRRDGAEGCKDASSKTNKPPTFLQKILITLVSDKSMTDGPTDRPSHRDVSPRFKTIAKEL